MTPIHFSGVTHVLGAPRDWNEAEHGPCAGLPTAFVDGQFMSCGRPTWRQRLALLFGRCITLFVIGSGHPPVMLGVARVKGRKADGF